MAQFTRISLEFGGSFFQGPPNGGVSNGGVSRSGLVPAFLSFLGLSRFFWDFPDLLGDGPGIFPIGPFSLSRPIKSTYEEQSRKGPRHNLDLSPKKWETPGFGNPPGLASLNFLLTVGASLLTVKLLCLQSLKALIRLSFPL